VDTAGATVPVTLEVTGATAVVTAEIAGATLLVTAETAGAMLLATGATAPAAADTTGATEPVARPSAPATGDSTGASPAEPTLAWGTAVAATGPLTVAAWPTAEVIGAAALEMAAGASGWAADGAAAAREPTA
jgi:hypothetical protein